MTSTLLALTTALSVADKTSLGDQHEEVRLAHAESDSDASSILSYTDTTSINVLPPELVRQILRLVADDRFETLVVEGQFEEIETQCKSCTYRSIAIVCRDWESIARAHFHRTLVLDKVNDSAPLVEALAGSPRMASEVRKIDASLRGRNAGPPDLISVDESAAVVQAEERERVARSEKERDLVLQALDLCPFITHFDADFGFHHRLSTPGLLPSSIRSLTFRNIDAKAIFPLLTELPCLRDLTLRLVLDFYLDPASSAVATCQLTRFELSIVGWGETDTSTINRLLAGSHHSLQTLVLRNKAAISSSAGGFLPVARHLIAQVATWPQFESLEVKDIPKSGRRAKGETPLSWFPLRPVTIPSLRKLHLTGVSYDAAFFQSLGAPHLASLTIEDYDCASGQPLVSALREKRLFDHLRELRVVEHESGWGEEREAIEEWCTETGVKLQASWRMRRLDRRW